MAINNDDKKFIKDTIDNALSNYEKKSDDKLKKYEENRKKLSKQEREDYIAILQKKNEQGEATLAQKFEMLKLSVENAVPEDLKDAFSSGKKAVKGGLNQAGRGLEHITGRIMETNPLTALLWQNRDLIKAGLDIGVGGIRAVGGVAKGAALGAAGLFNQALNMRKKQQAEETNETEDDVNVSRFSPVFGTSKENPVAEILEQKQDWQKQIDDIHKILIKQNKEQNVSNKTLSEGLGGLGKTMTTVKGFVDLIQSKQKLILAGVLVGVAALVGLAMWFQNGGMSKMIDGIKDGIIGSFATEKGKQARQNADKYVQGELNKIKTDAKALDSTLNNMNMANTQQAFNVDIKNVKGSNLAEQEQNKQKQIRANLQNIGIQGNHASQLMKLASSGYMGLSSSSARRLQNNKAFEFNLPFETEVSNIWQVDETYSDFQLRRGQGASAKYVVLTKAFSISVSKGKKKAYEKIAVLDVGSVVFGDINAFINIKDGESAEQALFNMRAPEIAQNANQIMDKPYHTGGLDFHNKMADEHIGVYKKYETTNLQDKAWTETSSTNTTQNGSTTKEQPVTTTVTPVSDNSQKAQQQTQTLKQQEVAADEKYNKEAQQALIEPQSQTQSTISVDGDKTAYVFSDVQLSQAQYGAMTGNLMNLNIA